MISRDPVRSILLSLSLALLSGCHEMDLFRLSDSKEVREKQVTAALRGEDGHSRLVGDYINITGLNQIMLEGVGLVTRLDNTGDDPPASPYRTQLLEDMRKRNIKDPNEVLRNPSTTLVIVRAYLPPLLKKGENFDVEVILPQGSEATSLNGGWLLECELSEHASVSGRVLKGTVMAKASGPILVSTGEGDDGDTSMMRQGTIPSGARYVGDDRNLSVFLRGDYRSVRMSRRIANRIGQRFHDYDDSGIKRPLAEAKTDSRIELIVHSRYRDNYPRYLQCIRHIQLNDSAVGRRIRMQELREELQNPATAGQASLELEAIGPEAVPILKSGLTAPDLEARFRAAEALAYLGRQDGVDVLAEVADKQPAFRVFALAALATLDSGEAALALRDLMNHNSIETRYGAFRALSVRPANAVYIGGSDMEGKFKLHLIDSTGEPLVHLTRRKRSEIVLFGADQQFRTPMFVRAGRHIMIKGEPGSSYLTISRFATGERDRKERVTLRVADVIQAASAMGASYPDIVQMLVQAEKQHNLPGKIGIDALPPAGRTFIRRRGGDESEAGGEETQVGDQALAPNLFEVTARPDNSLQDLPVQKIRETSDSDEEPEAPVLDDVQDAVGFEVQ
ncbi:flagellar basal body P-ring protein FlgI [Maioricimonas sp. JC845]|uniref:flagellar basal body P-ring protein FlgI n=1 Tax=Maioricimonas sp. JC845 TaxID=3232138 RepID=UPI00345963E9